MEIMHENILVDEHKSGKLLLNGLWRRSEAIVAFVGILVYQSDITGIRSLTQEVFDPSQISDYRIHTCSQGPYTKLDNGSFHGSLIL